MAHGFTRSGRGARLRYAAKLDPLERQLVRELMSETLEMIAPGASAAAAGESAAATPPAATTPQAAEDAFDAIVAGLGPLEGFDSAPVPPDARAFGDRDPALQRLLPAGHRDDEQAAAEFRRLTETGLRQRKADNLTNALTALSGRGSTVELTPEQAQCFLVALTDVRLVLGERMGLRADEDVEHLEERVASLPDDHPVVYAVAIYDFLTWLQETLAHALTEGLNQRNSRS